MTTGRTTPDYDFFGGAPTATPAAGSQFGTPAPAPGVVTPAPPRTQFGTPAPTVNQFGSPALAAGYAPAAAATARSSGVRIPSWVWRIGISLVIALVLGALGVGRFAGLFDRDLEAPDTLDGLSLADDDRAADLGGAMSGLLGLAGIEEGDVVMGVYDENGSPGAFLFAYRQHTPAETARTHLAPYGEVVDVGSGTLCTTSVSDATSMCLRSEGELTVMVARRGASDPFDAARVVNEAWRTF